MKKVYFPREILPLAVDRRGARRLRVAVGGPAASSCSSPGTASTCERSGCIPLAFLTLLVFTTAMTFWVAGLNVRYRDVQHLLSLGLLVWFWLTPIVYQGALVQELPHRRSRGACGTCSC